MDVPMISAFASRWLSPASAAHNWKSGHLFHDPSLFVHRYIHTFQQGFDAGLKDVQLAFMQSDGGLSPVDLFSGHKAILSGPAGGWVSLTIVPLHALLI